jgi:hypothetical protein
MKMLQWLRSYLTAKLQARRTEFVHQINSRRRELAQLPDARIKAAAQGAHCGSWRAEVAMIARLLDLSL